MFYNCHIHTFTDLDVPDRYLPLALAKILKTHLGAKALTGILKGLIPFTQRDLFDKYARFVSIGKLRDQGKIFHDCAKFYPADTRFLIHAMDMAYMGAGKVSRSYPDQLHELGELARQDQRVLPFMMVDPRREGVVDLLKEMHETYGYRGIKIYPTIGYYPYDQRLDLVYDYCTAHHLAVMAHCGPYNPTYFKGSKQQLRTLLTEGENRDLPSRKTNQEWCTIFTHPSNYHEVIRKHPELKICLAHFGSTYYWERYIHDPEDADNWFVVIKEMISTYPHLYTDISYTMNQVKYFSLLKVMLANDRLRKKILFGSDYYMVHTRSDERRFGLDLRAFIGEENFDWIARKNPENYLA